MSRAGFEPALPKETDLKSVALDHSANETFGDTPNPDWGRDSLGIGGREGIRIPPVGVEPTIFG